MDTKTFNRKWNGKQLADAGSTVSNEYRGFQTALSHLVTKLATDCGATIVNITKGHYFETFMIERGGKYCYISRSDCFNR